LQLLDLTILKIQENAYLDFFDSLNSIIEFFLDQL